MNVIRLLPLLLLPLSMCVSAETAWITDKLRLNMYELPASQGNKIATLTTGTRVEIIERQRLYAKVRTPSGLVGWVKGAYLETVKPATLRLTELQARHRQVLRQLAELRQQFNQLNRETRDIRATRMAERAKLKSARELMQQYRHQANSLQQKLDSMRASLPLGWVLGLITAALLIGLILGYMLYDARLRKRHGGFRL